ncbi:hypothetical protein [Glycomyces arizonensis]|uniref:hypothetical protein n=1 Tax=Glycomyces arizonensis TaxID=256035 RepID=UPI000404D16D|nr:hypothetical protein [Glycomyces arizonensis]
MTDDSSNIADHPPETKSNWQKAGEATPGAKQFLHMAETIDKARTEDEVSAGAAAVSVAADIANLGLEAVGGWTNPLGLLVGMGLDMVLTFVEPINKILTWLSGDPDAMMALQDRWGQFQEVLVNLREDVDDAWSQSLATSQSPTADAARDKVGGMGAAIQGCAFEIAQIREHLNHAHMLSKTIYEVIKSLLSALIEQLIIHGLIALALAYPSAGASIAKFLMFTARKTAMDMAVATLRVALAQGLARRLALIGADVLRSTVMQSSRNALMWAGGPVSGAVSGIASSGDPGNGVATGSSDQAGGMSGYIDVDPAEFDVCASELSRLKGNADRLREAVEGDTDTDYWTWGLACQGFVDGYNEQRTEIAGDVALISPALEGNSQRFTDVASNYRLADEESAAELDKSGGEL